MVTSAVQIHTSTVLHTESLPVALTECSYVASNQHLLMPLHKLLVLTHVTEFSQFSERERAAQRGVLSPSCGCTGLPPVRAQFASTPGATTPPAGSNELRPAGADTRHWHCDTPARHAGRPEGRALCPRRRGRGPLKARSRPSMPNLIVLGTRG